MKDGKERGWWNWSHQGKGRWFERLLSTSSSSSSSSWSSRCSHGRSTIEIKFSEGGEGSCRGELPTRDTYTLCWDWIREFMSRRQILSGFGGKHHAPTRGRKSRRREAHTSEGGGGGFVVVLRARSLTARLVLERGPTPEDGPLVKNFRARDRDSNCFVLCDLATSLWKLFLEDG